jgi:hypothetical protein
MEQLNGVSKLKSVNCGYRNHDFKPTGKREAHRQGYDLVIFTEFECTKCGISTSWEVTN